MELINISMNIIPIQSELCSYEYNRTLNNDTCNALKYRILENPKSTINIKVKICNFVPYKVHKNNIRVVTKHTNIVRG